MKRLNVKLIVIVAIAFVVLSAGVVVVHGIQVKRNADSLVVRAEKAKESGDVEEALELYRRYRSFRPDDKQAFSDYAMLFADATATRGYHPREVRGTIDALEQAVRNDPNKPEVRRKLVDFLMRVGMFSPAKDHLEKLKAGGENDTKTNMLLARCEVANSNFSTAATLLGGLVGYDSTTKKIDPAKATDAKEVDAYILLAAVLREKLKSDEAADQVIEQLVAANPDSSKAYLAQAQYLQKYFDRDKAKASVEKALALAPGDADALLQAADMALSAKDYPAAEKLLSDGLKKHAKDLRFHRALVLASMAQNKLPEAEERLVAGLKALPNHPLLLEMQFNLQAQQAEFDAARRTLKTLESINFPPLMRDFMEARLLVAEDKHLEAIPKLEKLRSLLLAQRPDLVQQIDLLEMECFNATDQTDLAMRASERVLKDNPGLIQAQLGMAGSLLKNGKTNEALRLYERLAVALETENKLSSIPQVWSPLLQLRLAEQLRLPQEKRDWTKIDTLLAKLRAAEAVKEPALSMLTADVLFRKGQADDARKLLDELATKYPNDQALRSTLVSLALQDRKADDAEKLIDSAPAEVRDSVPMMVARINAALVRGGKTDEVKQALAEIAAKAEPMPAAGRAGVYSALANAYLGFNDRDTAKGYFEKAAELSPKEDRLRWSLFDLARDSGDEAAMTQLAEWFEKHYGANSAQAKLARAAQLVAMVRDNQRGKVSASQQQIVLDAAEKAQLEKAREMLREVATQRPDWHERPKIAAEIDGLEGRIDDAISNLREALRKGPANQQIVRQLVQLLYSRGRLDDVAQVIDEFGTPAGLGQIEAEARINRGDVEGAIKTALANVPKDSKNPNDYLLQGRVLARAGKPEDAEAAFRKAVEFGPELPETWLSLVAILVANKKVDEARQMVQEAQIKLPEDKRSLAIAQAYEALGEMDQAEQNYLAALSAQEKDLNLKRLVASFYLRVNQNEKAKKYLNEILRDGPAQAAEAENLRWAKRATAQLMASTGDYQEFLKAMQLLTPPQGETLTPEDLTMRAALLAQREEPSSVRQAVRLLEDLRKMRALATNERLSLALLYERIGNWSGAREEMLSLVGQPNAEPLVYATFVEMLLRRGEVDEAVTWAKQLQARVPGDNNVVQTLVARTAAKQGRGAQVAAELLKQVPTERPLKKEQLPAVRQIAGLFEQIEQFDATEKLLRDVVAADPDQSLVLAAFLARRGKIDEALQLAEARRIAAPPLALQVGISALRQKITPPTAEQIAKVNSWFEKQLREDPESTSLQMQLADLRDREGKYDEVERLYREILARPETSKLERAIVGNNLAFVLTMQNKDLPQALEYVGKSIELLGPRSDLLDTRGLVYLAMKDNKQALADLTDAVTVPEPAPLKFVHLAMAQMAAGDKAAAQKSLDKAKALKLNADDISPLEKPKYEALLRELGRPA